MRQQLFYRGLNKKCNAALRIIKKKTETAAKLNSERQNDAAAVQTAEKTGKVPQESGIMKNKEMPRT
jgi:hypothetical protein